MSTESPATPPSATMSASDGEHADAADAAEQMAAATSVLRTHLSLFGDAQAVDPYPM